jgi:hypothetical protein
METTTRAIIKLQAAARCSINLHRFLRIKQAIIHFQGCTRRLFLFCDEKDIPDELILEAMRLHCNRVNDKAARLGTMIIILNLLHDNGFYFMTGN